MEKARSCFWRISFAKAGEEMTTVVFRPSFKHIIGPYILASLARDLWGLSPSFRRLPMTGSGTGPGGSFGLVLLLLISKWRNLSKVMVDKTYRIKINNSMIANQTRSQSCSFSRYYLLQRIFRYNTKKCWHLLLEDEHSLLYSIVLVDSHVMLNIIPTRHINVESVRRRVGFGNQN